MVHIIAGQPVGRCEDAVFSVGVRPVQALSLGAAPDDAGGVFHQVLDGLFRVEELAEAVVFADVQPVHRGGPDAVLPVAQEGVDGAAVDVIVGVVDDAGADIQPQQAAGIGPDPQPFPLPAECLHIQGRNAAAGRFPQPQGLSAHRVVVQQAAIVGAHPERAVGIFGDAADGLAFRAAAQVRKADVVEAAHTGRNIVDAAIVGGNPEAPLVVFQGGIDEFVGEGERVLAVVGEEDALPGERVVAQQALVRSDEEGVGGDAGERMQVAEAFLTVVVLDDFPAAGGQIIQPLVPGAQPDAAVLVFRDGDDARRGTVSV